MSFFRHGRHAAPPGGPMFDLPELAHQPVTEMLPLPAPSLVLDDTQAWPAPLPRVRKVRTARPPAVRTSPVRAALHITGRTLIGDSIPDEHGRFTLTCGHCGASWADAGAGTFRALRDSARTAGWRQDLYGSWACTRDVRSNPAFVPQMAPARRAA
jgi:hypothetical protein